MVKAGLLYERILQVIHVPFGPGIQRGANELKLLQANKKTKKLKIFSSSLAFYSYKAHVHECINLNILISLQTVLKLSVMTLTNDYFKECLT